MSPVKRSLKWAFHNIEEGAVCIRRAEQVADDVGDIIAEMFNLFEVLWTAAVNDMEDGERLLVMRTVADAGQRLRKQAERIDLIKHQADGYVVPGLAQEGADLAVCQCVGILENLETVHRLAELVEEDEPSIEERLRRARES